MTTVGKIILICIPCISIITCLVYLVQWTSEQTCIPVPRKEMKL